MHRGLWVSVAVAAVLLFATTSPAWATVEFGVSPAIPANVTVGQTSVAGSFQIANDSTSPDNTGNLTVSAISLVPACGTTTPTGPSYDCPTADEDPGVFSLSSTGTGEAGTACAGITFTITVTDSATGEVQFTPSGGAVILTAPGSGSSSACRIDFTFDVNTEPTTDASPGAPGVQTAQIGSAVGSVDSDAGFSVGSSLTTVAFSPKATPTITTTASEAVLLGGKISDTATVSGGSTPTGTITFGVFGPANPSCTGAPIFTSTTTVNGNGAYTSQAFTPTAAGTYQFVALYGGDANNAAVVSVCGAANESVSVETGGLPPAPVLSSVTQSASRWREGSALPHISSAKPPVGTTFSFTLNIAAKVTFAFTRTLPGRKVKSHCVVPTKSNHHQPSCTRTVTVGSLSFTAHAGVNKVSFQGRISHTKKLALGTYTLTITAGKSSKHLTFTIVK